MIRRHLPPRSRRQFRVFDEHEPDVSAGGVPATLGVSATPPLRYSKHRTRTRHAEPCPRPIGKLARRCLKSITGCHFAAISHFFGSVSPRWLERRIPMAPTPRPDSALGNSLSHGGRVRQVTRIQVSTARRSSGYSVPARCTDSFHFRARGFVRGPSTRSRCRRGFDSRRARQPPDDGGRSIAPSHAQRLHRRKHAPRSDRSYDAPFALSEPNFPWNAASSTRSCSLSRS
jgi:hypothetical protein